MLAYHRTGLLNKPPLVFFHGLFGVKEDWEGVCNYLARDFCCYLFDLPGHGASILQTINLETIVSSIDALSLKSPSIIGYSLGGRLALQLRERFDKLVAIGAHLGLADAVAKRERLIHDEKWADRLDKEPIEKVLRDWYDQPLFSTMRKKEELIAQRAKQDTHGVAAALRTWSLGHQTLISPPSNCLFLVGEEDLKFVTHYSTLSLSFKTIASSGHAAHLENPKACAEAIQSFMGKK